MTKEAYFEMCAQLGTEPVEEEIPIELVEFPIEIQAIFQLYEDLEDKMSDFNGVFIGKSFAGFPYFYEHYCPEIPLNFCMKILKTIEAICVDKAIRKHNAKNNVVVPKNNVTP